MRLSEYLKDRIIYIMSMSAAIIFTVAALIALNPAGGPALSLFIGLLLILALVLPLTFDYLKRKAFYNDLLCRFDSLDKKNLIAEITSLPDFKEGMILCDILRGSNKAMLEEINKYKSLQEEYREYIELWIHEVKTPISSSKLIIQNNKSAVTDSISEELDKIEAFIEQALFYSRSNTVEKDYIVKEINLQKACFDVLKKNTGLLIHNRIKIVTDGLDINVYSDEKWLQFILGQLITNSVKYMDRPEPCITITARKEQNSAELSISDNGIGIKQSELPRIFDKGFTGTNGRKNERSTGMGLYICKKLCDKLDLTIKASSEYGSGTSVTITFPISSMTDMHRT